MKTFKTKAGTELQIMDLRGKDYLQVAQRIIWFREEHPDWSIETCVTPGNGSSLAKATISNPEGRVMATSHKYEDKQGFADYIEKSETGAIGRALALCGYGTQFCGDELDENARIVDSPVQLGKPAAPVVSPKSVAPVIASKIAAIDDPSKDKISFGKYKGLMIDAIDLEELAGYVKFLTLAAIKDGKGLHAVTQDFVDRARSRIAKESPDLIGLDPVDDFGDLPF